MLLITCAHIQRPAHILQRSSSSASGHELLVQGNACFHACPMIQCLPPAPPCQTGLAQTPPAAPCMRPRAQRAPWRRPPACGAFMRKASWAAQNTKPRLFYCSQLRASLLVAKVFYNNEVLTSTHMPLDDHLANQPSVSEVLKRQASPPLRCHTPHPRTSARTPPSAARGTPRSAP